MSRLMAIFAVLFPVISFAQNCDDLFEERHLGATKAREAFSCYEKSVTASRLDKGHALSRMSYLKFYISEYFPADKSNALLEGIALAEKGVLLYGPKYDVTAYLKLSPEEKHSLGWLLYNYGLTTSRYVEIAGPLEAIRRKEDIQKSMTTIIRMKEEPVSFYGAHRTLGIFHMKVPAIAGGNIKLSEPYFTKAIQSTIAFGTISAFPSNNLALAELYLKLNQDAKACAEIKSVAALSENDIVALANGHILETRQTVAKARDLMEKKCR